MKTPSEEQKIRRQILDFLTHIGAIVRINLEKRKYNRSKYLPNGWPDISGSYKGRGLFVETKAPGNKATEEQLDFLARARAHGNIALIAYSVEDVAKEIFGIKDEKRQSLLTELGERHVSKGLDR